MTINKFVSNSIYAGNITSALIANSAVTVEKIADGAISFAKLDANTQSNITQGSAPKITTIVYPNSDLAANVVGGDSVVLIGTGFENGITVYIDNTQAPVVSYGNATQISFTTPAKAAGDYLIYVINPNGSTGIGVPGISYSGLPTWVTSTGALTSTSENPYANVTLNAQSDSNITYSIFSGNLPPGLTLNPNTGLISGTVLSNVANLSSNTTFNFVVDAEDEELQNTTRSFSITYIPTFPTWFSPNAGALSQATSDTYYTANLNAISNSGVVYSIPAGNLTSNLALSGNAIVGTPADAEAPNTYYFTVRATDAEGHFTDREFSLVVEVAADTYFKNTTLLLNGDGTNGVQNNTLLDSSANNFTITRNGNTTQGTFSPFSQDDGKWGAYFDGSGDWLTTSSTTLMDVTSSSQTFTIEAWIYPTAINASGPQGYRFTSILSKGVVYLSFGYTSTGVLRWYTFNGSENYINSSSGVILQNQWQHVAVVSNSGSITLYANGQSVATGSLVTPNGGTGVSPKIGHADTTAAADGLNGYISNLRTTNTAVYTTNFTPSTTPLTAITNTSLLTCQSNRFKDNSANNFAITVNGNTSIQPFSPFAPSAAYDSAVNGGSGYFDGSGDYLTAPKSTDFNFGTGDFTIEAWAYLPSTATFIIANADNGNLTNGGWRIIENGSVNVSGGSQVLLGTFTYPIGQWFHVAVTRNGTTARGFINGTQSFSTTNSTNITTSGTNDLGIGGRRTGVSGLGSYTSFTTGYISSVRIIKGTALYTSAFTPPTAPLTAIANTSFLCNFTNAGIFDNTGKNNLETVGNAQISTSVKKFGTGSLAFDGTGDYLTAPASQNLVFGTGDFTIECWVYINSGSGSNNGILQISGTTGGLQPNQTNTITLYVVDTSGLKFGVYYANTLAYAGVTATTQTWTHLALVRSSGSLKLYINGTADSTFGTKTDTTNYSGQNICVGGYYSTSYLWNGYIDDLRITKGVARYTANFTPPTSAFLLR